MVLINFPDHPRLFDCRPMSCSFRVAFLPVSRILAAILNARARRAVAWRHEIPHVRRVLDTMQQLRIKPHENELRFVRQLVDRGKFEHSWLPVDPNANLKRVRSYRGQRM